MNPQLPTPPPPVAPAASPSPVPEGAHSPWLKVYLGLGWMAIAVNTWFIGIALALISALVAPSLMGLAIPQTPTPEDPAMQLAVQVMAIGAGVASLIAYAIFFVGVHLCRSIPSETSLRPNLAFALWFGIVSLALVILMAAIGLSLGSADEARRANGIGAAGTISVIQLVLSFSSHLSLVLALRKLAEQMRDSALADRWTAFLTVMVITYLGTFAMANPMFGTIVGLATMASVFWFGRLARATQQTVFRTFGPGRADYSAAAGAPIPPSGQA